MKITFEEGNFGTFCLVADVVNNPGSNRLDFRWLASTFGWSACSWRRYGWNGGL